MRFKFILAILFGIFVTWFGLFGGLQISPVIGNILAFPFVLSAYLTGNGFGNQSIGVAVVLFAVTSLFWATAFLFAWRLTKQTAS